MSTGEKCHNYALILKEDFSGYVRLTATKEAIAEVVSNTLTSWFSSFGVDYQCVSNRDTHFKNKLVKILKNQVREKIHFKLA